LPTNSAVITAMSPFSQLTTDSWIISVQLKKNRLNARLSLLVHPLICMLQDR